MQVKAASVALIKERCGAAEPCRGSPQPANFCPRLRNGHGGSFQQGSWAVSQLTLPLQQAHGGVWFLSLI